MTQGAPKIKICGVTRPDDAARIAAAGVDFIGLNFWPTSKRYLAPDRGPEVASAARSAGAARLVGVFVNASVDAIAQVARDVALDVIQLHGDEPLSGATAVAQATGCAVWKAISVGNLDDLARLDAWPTDALLLDAPSTGRGGAGVVFDWALARDARRMYPARRFVLAGGLTADNVCAAIDAVLPWAVDVASGVESAPGIKDTAKVSAFVAAAAARARRADPG